MKEYEWTLTDGGGNLVGTGQVSAMNEPRTFREAFKQLDSDQQEGVEEQELQLSTQIWKLS